MLPETDPLPILEALIRCPSVTPEEGGALTYLDRLLATHGFHCERLAFASADSPEIDNLVARIGRAGPHLCFAGHTDVVPPGPAESWTPSALRGRAGGRLSLWPRRRRT